MYINFTESIHSINVIGVGDSTHDYINISKKYRKWVLQVGMWPVFC